MVSILLREICYNPEQEHVVPYFLQEGINIVKDLVKIPTFTKTSCEITNFPNLVDPNTWKINFSTNPDHKIPNLVNGKPAVLTEKIRIKPCEPVNCKKFYSLTELLNLEKREYIQQNLIDLAKSMIAIQGDIGEDPTSQKSSSLPALFTYLGQFLDHDVSGVTIPDFESKIDINTLINNRCALLDLDSVFDIPTKYDEKGFIILEKNVNGVLDVPRTKEGVQIMGDIRNGENQIILQVHMLFIKFYNRVLQDIYKENPFFLVPNARNQAKKILKFTWQWLLVHSFLRLACGPYYASLFDVEGEPNFDIISPNKLGALNAEWTFGFYRWHSLPQESYYPNGKNDEVPIFSLSQKLNFGGFKPLEEKLVLDFGFFWPMEGYNGFQQTHRFGNILSYPLGHLPNPVIPDKTVNLAERTLLRQNQVMMGNGQDFAVAFDIPEELIIRKIKLFDENFIPNFYLPVERIKELEEYFGNNTPLFYYILYEAREIGKGENLGPLGSKLFGLTVLAQLYSDPDSYIYSNWFPVNRTWGCNRTYEYTFEDFIEYAENKPVQMIEIFKPNIYTNFFNPEKNIATQEIVRKNFLPWTGKIINSLTIYDRGKKLRIVNNLKNSLSNLTIYVYNEDETKILETLTLDFEDKYVELIWNGHGYMIGQVIN